MKPSRTVERDESKKPNKHRKHKASGVPHTKLPPVFDGTEREMKK